MSLRKLPKNIYPCSRYFCKCIEYINFSTSRFGSLNESAELPRKSTKSKNMLTANMKSRKDLINTSLGKELVEEITHNTPNFFPPKDPLKHPPNIPK